MSDDWYTYHDGYTTEWDDWVSGESWTGERTIWETPISQRSHTNLRQSEYSNPNFARLILRIKIYGRRSGSRRLRPTHVYPDLWFGNQKVDLSKVSCKSVVDATRKADAHPELEAKIQELMKLAYGKRSAYCVYRKTDGGRHAAGASIWEILQGCEGWAPWATMFSPYRDMMAWPIGKYAVVKPGLDGPSISLHKVTHYTSSGCHGCLENPELPSWFDVEPQPVRHTG